MNRWINRFFTLLYPDRCLSCDRVTVKRHFCAHCTPFVPIEKKTCERCGLPIALCRCRWNFYYYDAVYAVFENTDTVRTAFYRFKFGGHYVAGRYYAKEMAALAQRRYNIAEFDLITAVPTHRSTIRERGYDHTAVLARELAKELSVPFEKTLWQPKRGPKQHLTKRLEQRFENVRDKYRPRRGVDLTGKTVLLVDDIETTGATMSACARELKLLGAERVLAITALMTFPKKKQTEDCNLPHSVVQ